MVTIYIFKHNILLYFEFWTIILRKEKKISEDFFTVFVIFA